MVDVAARLAAERRSVIDLLAFSPIPLSEEMDVDLPDIDSRLRGLSDQSGSWAARYGIAVRCRHERTRDPAATILEAADRGGAELILLGATDASDTTYRRLARDTTARRIAASARVPVMFVRPPRTGA